jgi:predicted metal-dependent hydrolase
MKIVRSRRKTIALVITCDAELVVRAPWSVPDRYIDDFLDKKRKWIDRKISEIAARPKVRKKEFAAGEKLFFLGREYEMAVDSELGKGITLGEKFFVSRKAMAEPRSSFERWYRREAKAFFPERISVLAGAGGKRPGSLRISGARGRWGSCGYRGSVNLSWRLLMAPVNVIDYVIAHELAHLEHRDHSAKFWDEVKRILPAYEEGQKWLKENGGSLYI